MHHSITILICLGLLLGQSAHTEEIAKVKPLSSQQLATAGVRVATVQITGNWQWGQPPDPHTDPADLAIPYIERAATDHVDLVCFPELYLGMFRVPSPQTDKIADAARKQRINVTVGCFEVIDATGNYHNVTLIFNRDGELVGRYNKAFQAVGDPNHGWPPLPNDPEWMMKPGNEFPVFDLDFGRIGILTCYDGYFPEVWRILALKGAEVILWPNARGGNVEDFIVRTAVTQNYVHVITTNKAVGGGTMVVAWPNVIVAEAHPEREEMVTAQLELGPVRSARIHAREFFQRRPAIFDELTKEYPIWMGYGVPAPPGVTPPLPSREEHERILKSARIDFTHN